MRLQSVFRHLKVRPARRTRRAARGRAVNVWPQLEVLEPRTLLSCSVDLSTADSHASLVDSPANGNVVEEFAQGGVRVVQGEATVVDGSRISTWALLSPHDNSILAVGASFSVKIAEDMPEHGTGPAGAIASLEFPAVVQQTTFFNHLEIQPEPEGHVSPPGAINPNYFGVSHFDFHFYNITEEEVRAIPAGPPVPPVSDNLLAPGYLPAGPSIAEMGRHSSPAFVLTDTDPFTAVMVAGYVPNASQLHFLEPMVTQDFLLGRQDFSLPMPLPQSLGLASPTQYPTRFEAVYHGDAWHFVFSEFITLGGTGTATAATLSADSTAAAPTSTLVGDVPEFPAAFAGLNVAVEQFQPSPPPIVPPNPIQVSPVFLLNFGDSVDGGAVPQGLNVAVNAYPVDPTVTVSPVFFGLADDDGGPVVDTIHDDGALESLDMVWSDLRLLEEEL